MNINDISSEDELVEKINGYEICRTPDGKFYVYSSNGTYLDSFSSLEEAIKYIEEKISRENPDIEYE
ncbi:hypothetical protein [Gloeomargarita lithophora]|uniref:hypothetical protein n=1 Tax=Gloeomargarita lithophora TaxID=1188228 RepID=UPI0008F8FD69|nr:hypothetical protein [Gloeomargarita lithophora]